MLIVNKGSVLHDGVKYGPQKVLPEMPRKDEQRLLDLGVCIEWNGSAPETIPEPAQEPAGQVGDAVNLTFDPDEAIRGTVRK